MRPLREKDILKAIIDWLTATGTLHWRCNLGGVVRSKGERTFFTPNPIKGFPDIGGIIPGGSGRFFAVEVKRPGGKLTEEQRRWQKELQGGGAVHIVATSVEDVRQSLLLALASPSDRRPLGSILGPKAG